MFILILIIYIICFVKKNDIKEFNIKMFNHKLELYTDLSYSTDIINNYLSFIYVNWFP